MSNNKIKLVVEVDEYCRDAIIRHRNGTYGAQLPYYIISSAFEAIANGTPITEGDLIMFRTLMTEIANKGLPFEEVLLLIDNAKTPTEGDCISREALKDITYINKGNFNTVEGIREWIDNAPTVEPRIEYGTDGQPYKLSMTNGKEYERPKGTQIAWKRGYHQAKEDIAKRIKEQFNEHHELIPYWLSIGDVKGGAE